MDLEWFPFYWRDFDEATREFTNEETGAYFRLLYYQWQFGSIPADRERAGRITGERFSDRTWKGMLTKFVPDPSVPGDRLVNQRMKTVRATQETKAENRIRVNTENGLRGVLARAAKKTAAVPQAVSDSTTAAVTDSVSTSVPQTVSARQPELRTKNKEKKDMAADSTGLGVRPEPSRSKNLGARRTRRAPEDFGISEGIRKWAQQALPKAKPDAIDVWLRKELVKFKDHEFNSAKSDWDATLRNWLRRCLEIGNAPAGVAPRDADEEKRRADVLKTAAIFGATRGPEESFDQFEARVNAKNQRRIAELGGSK